MAGGRPLRVAVIDDSVVVRRLVADALRSDPQIVEVRTAGDGRSGVALVKEMKPDLVTMDVQMPVMDGIEAVRLIRTFDTRIPIIMFSTLTESGARATLDAFSAGATDFVTKPGQAKSIGASLHAVRLELIPKVLALGDPGSSARSAVAEVKAARAASGAGLPPARSGGTPPGGLRAGNAAGHAPAARRQVADSQPKIIAIGSSTGGPEALAKLLARLPGDLPVPVVVTQHMPAMFTRLLADRLNANCKLSVAEAVDNVVLAPGSVTIAPGGKHLVVVREDGVLRGRLRDTPPVNSCKPSVDTLFASLTAAVGASALAVVLTGMGTDGALGAALVVQAGGRAWAQDEASSVVWGMPGATVATGCVERVLTLEGLSAAIIATCKPSRDRAEPAAALGGTR